jgi:exodeoxyribonuclease VII small subunit
VGKSRKTDADGVGETFDQGVTALEELVGALESGDLPLEQALEAFEKGVGLVRRLNERLNEAEKKIEILSRGSAGDLVSEAIDEGDPDD